MGTAKPRPPRRRELWYDVAGYEGQYQVSDFGRVLALARIDAGGHQRSARVHRPHGGASGRLFVSLCKEGVSTCHCVSALLARAYGIPNPRNEHYVIHLNGDYGDFRRANLAWATLAEQRIHDGHKVHCRYYGVTCHGNRRGVLRWVASFRWNYRRHTLGHFRTPEEAAFAYDREIKRLRLNRPLNGVARPAAPRASLPSSPGEIWRGFPGAERAYQISNKGRVRTLAHLTKRGQRVLPRLRKITVAANGYRSVVVRRRRFGIASVMQQVFPHGVGSRLENRARSEVGRRKRRR